MHAFVRRPLVEPIAPLVCNHFAVPGSTTRFLVSCFRGSDWSLKDMYEPQDVYRHPELAARLGAALSGLGAWDVYAPTPVKFNGEIMLPAILSDTLHLPHNVYLHRNGSVYADGTFLSHRGEGGVFSAGGCGMVLAAYGDDLIFAHAGRESIIDRRRVRTRGAEEDRKRDLVDNILVALGVSDHKKVHLWPLYFIGPEHFVHHKDDPNPKHAEYNRGAMEYLPQQFPGEFGEVDGDSIKIDLPRIFRAQCVKRGVPAGNVHLEHSYLAKELPTTRTNGGGRYLVAAVRLA